MKKSVHCGAFHLTPTKYIKRNYKFENRVMNLFVGNLNPETTVANLRPLFAEFGEVVSAKIIFDNATGMSRGFGFVEMADKFHAYDAIDNLDSIYFEGNIISVKEAKQNNTKSGGGDRRPFNKPRSPRPGGGGYGQGSGRSNYNSGGGSYGSRDNNYNSRGSSGSSRGNYNSGGNYSSGSNYSSGNNFNRPENTNNNNNHNTTDNFNNERY